MNSVEEPENHIRVLVVVHPGSACGSANMNLGRTAARAAREELVHELTSWDAGVVIIDGELSDELEEYPALDQALKNALDRASTAGLLSRRVLGDDPEQVNRIEELVEELGASTKRMTFTVSGAWYHPEDGSGCVGSVIEALKKADCRAAVSPHAVELFFEDDEPEVDAPSRGPRL